MPSSRSDYGVLIANPAFVTVYGVIGEDSMHISMNVNGRSCSSEVEPRTLLVDFLRDSLALTGTKIGCDTGQCGACTILLDGVAVKSCMLLAVQAEGCEVTTVEGLAQDGHLNALQEGFWEKHGVQCGYCTPGMVMSMTDLLRHNPDPSDAEIRQGLDGNLCRCTGYQSVVQAVKYAVEKTRSPVHMVVDTPAKEFYARQVRYLLAGDPDKLVEDNYNENAVVVSGSFIVKGKKALKEHFRNYMKWVHIKEVKSTDCFAETENTVLFEATVATNFGVGKVYDAFVLSGGKIDYHFTGVR